MDFTFISVRDGHVAVTLPAAMRRLLSDVAETFDSPPAPADTVQLPDTDDVIARLEAEMAAERVKMVVDFDTELGDRISAEMLASDKPVLLDSGAAEVWMRWLNRRYICVRAAEDGPAQIGTAQDASAWLTALDDPDQPAEAPQMSPVAALLAVLLSQTMHAIRQIA